MADRIARCRMTNTTNDRCTGEALDPDGEVLICLKHAALVLELVAASGADMGLLVQAAVTVHATKAEVKATKTDLAEIRDGLAEIRTLVQELAQ